MYDTILIAFAHKLVIALVIKLVILKIVGKKNIPFKTYNNLKGWPQIIFSSF